VSEYVKYQHVERMGSLEVNGIDIGECYIFPKIDGSNGHIWLEEDKEVIRVGSRRKELSANLDNAGFFAYIQEYRNAFMHLLKKLPEGSHVFGEWLVPHSLKTYRKTAWRKFYIFDILLPTGLHMPFNQYKEILDEVGYTEYIDPIRILVNPKLEDIEKCLEENKYLIPDADGIGEGIVIKNYGFVNKHGRQTWGKIVTGEFKEKHRREMGAPVSSCTAYIEESIVEQFLTNEIIDKVYANINSEEEGFSSKSIPRLLGSVYYDFVRECVWAFVKKNKNPTINFKILQKFVNAKIKAVKPELF